MSLSMHSGTPSCNRSSMAVAPTTNSPFSMKSSKVSNKFHNGNEGWQQIIGIRAFVWLWKLRSIKIVDYRCHWVLRFSSSRFRISLWWLSRNVVARFGTSPRSPRWMPTSDIAIPPGSIYPTKNSSNNTWEWISSRNTKIPTFQYRPK